jgi:hypothetical protein
MNMGAMEAQMNKNLKAAQMRERMKAKAEAKAQQTQQAQQAQAPVHQTNPLTDEQIFSVFSTGEKVERTPRGSTNPTPTTNSAGGKKKRKGKK